MIIKLKINIEGTITVKIKGKINENKDLANNFIHFPHNIF